MFSKKLQLAIFTSRSKTFVEFTESSKTWVSEVSFSKLQFSKVIWPVELARTMLKIPALSIFRKMQSVAVNGWLTQIGLFLKMPP